MKIKRMHHTQNVFPALFLCTLLLLPSKSCSIRIPKGSSSTASSLSTTTTTLQRIKSSSCSTVSIQRTIPTAFSVPSSSSNSESVPAPLKLKNLLESEMNGTRKDPTPILLPCCYDGLTARLVARNGFEATFMTGFGVSGANGYPDTQLVSFGEMMNAAMTVAEGLSSAAFEMNRESGVVRSSIPCIADGDTGYGNAVNAKRTVFGYARSGMAGLMIEDQVAPKRCGHVSGKSIISFDDAVQRVKAACDARDEYESLYGPGTGPLVLARTDALLATTTAQNEENDDDGFDEAIRRCLAFVEVGADMTFLEAPRTKQQMIDYCSIVPKPKLANMLEYGNTPITSPAELKQMGYTMAAYPLTLLSASIKAMQQSLDLIKRGESTDDMILTFDETKDIVGFNWYAKEEDRYKTE
mmetsp:Transcript_29850/g.44031  ORF Transcript_29850/g.44031 Transcript_29850/m.44031 type:complete len:411 (-) Transcript_29850:62-1294(-)